MADFSAEVLAKIPRAVKNLIEPLKLKLPVYELNHNLSIEFHFKIDF